MDGGSTDATARAMAEAPFADSSHSTLETFSDSSAALIEAHIDYPRTHPLHTPVPNAHALSQPPPQNRVSILSAIPFLSASRQRRADRASAAAAAALAVANANAAANATATATATAAANPVPDAAPATPTPTPTPTSPRAMAGPPQQDVCVLADGLPDATQDGAASAEGMSAASADGMSAASDSESIEPRSVMMSRPTQRAASLLGEAGAEERQADDASPRADTAFAPRRGDLDDVPDDYELNIEGFRFVSKPPVSLSDVHGAPISSEIPSSLLRPFEKSYIKLEVISAKQIRCLIIFFNFFLLLALLHTVVLVALNNSSWRIPKRIIPLPKDLLTEKQKSDSTLGPIVLPKQITFVQNDDPDPDTLSDAPPTERTFSERLQTATSSQCTLDFSSMKATDATYARILAAFGLYQTRTALVPGPVCPLTGFATLQSVLPPPGQTFRQATIPAGPSDFTSGPPPGIGDIEGEPPSELVDAQGPGDGPSVPAPGTNPVESVNPHTHIVVYDVPVVISWVPNWAKITHHFLSAVLSVFFLVLGVLFAIRLFVAKRRNLTHEQIWTLILIFVTGLYFNVFENIIDVKQVIGSLDGILRPDEKFPGWVNVISKILESIRDAAFLAFTYFYLWASFDSYRILDPAQRLTISQFYLPKFAILVPFIAFQITLYVWMNLELSEVPLLSGPAMAFIFSSFRLTSYLKWELVFAVVKTILDALLLLIILRSALKAMRALEQAPYMKYRAKRVGFRFFLYINFVFYLFFFVFYWVTFFVKPVGDLVVLLVWPSNRVRTGMTIYFGSGAWWLIFAYVTCTAFVHLPHTSVGWFRGWFTSSALASPGSKWSFESKDKIEEEHSGVRLEEPSSKLSEKMAKSCSKTWSNDEETPSSLVDNDSELQQQIIEPITYRKRESKDSLELKANCFTMQTHVIMFNFAWYVYYYGTPKLENFRPRENPLPFEFSVDQHIKSEATDTQALVLDCTDRIIVTFKGTTSMKNLRTSIRLSQSWLSQVIRENADGEDESERLTKLFGMRYTYGKIHKGFATAYASVMTEVVQRVRKLRDEKMRPVFLTGHSLGGALATICSLDLWVKLNISRREIFVSTFGSPRVGNAYFAAVYKEVVPLHWRIVVDPDMIAKLPRVGYTHVGKKVVLTPHGDMIIDPNALENRPWTGEAAGFAYHRKASYLLAMRAWCVRYHGMTYTPVFWPFPVRPEDERRFAGAFDSSEDGDVDSGGWKVAQKIIRLDAMVDALGSVDGDQEENSNVAAVARWGRLTRRLLLNEKLGGGGGGGVAAVSGGGGI